MSILKNFVNPWESGGSLGSEALGTSILQNNVLENKLPQKDRLYLPSLSGVNPLSAKRLLYQIKETFKGTEVEDTFNTLRIANDGITIIGSIILLGRFLQTIKDHDVKALASGYIMAMTDKMPFIIEMVKREEKLSLYGKEQLELAADDSSIKYNNGKDVEKEEGGGKTTTANWEEEKRDLFNYHHEGVYCVIVIDSQENVEYSDGDRPSLAGELLAHELLGHGIGQFYPLNHLDTSIQMTNVYLRLKRKGYFRKDHGLSNHSENFNPHVIPYFYQ